MQMSRSGSAHFDLGMDVIGHRAIGPEVVIKSNCPKGSVGSRIAAVTKSAFQPILYAPGRIANYQVKKTASIQVNFRKGLCHGCTTGGAPSYQVVVKTGGYCQRCAVVVAYSSVRFFYAGTVNQGEASCIVIGAAGRFA